MFDVDAREIVARIPLSGNSRSTCSPHLTVSAVYVGQVRSSSLAVIDTRSHEVVDTIEVPSPNGIAFSPDHRSIYVTSVFDNSVNVIDVEAGKVVSTADVGEKPGYLALTKDGTRAYFVRPFAETVSVHGYRDPDHRGHDHGRQGSERGDHPRLRTDHRWRLF